MAKEADERLEEEEVTETFCGLLKDKQKEDCVQFYEELGEEQGKKNPDENRMKNMGARSKSFKKKLFPN